MKNKKTNKITSKNTTLQQKTEQTEHVMKLINKIQRIENLSLVVNQKRFDQQLQILPGNRTGIVASLNLR